MPQPGRCFPMRHPLIASLMLICWTTMLTGTGRAQSNNIKYLNGHFTSASVVNPVVVQIDGWFDVEFWTTVSYSTGIPTGTPNLWWDAAWNSGVGNFNPNAVYSDIN